jgi:hypothetical protein
VNLASTVQGGEVKNQIIAYLITRMNSGGSTTTVK